MTIRDEAMTQMLADAQLAAAGVAVIYADEAVRVTDADNQECVVTEDGRIAPVVGELSSKTTPEDFARFAAAARAWHAKHRVG